MAHCTRHVIGVYIRSAEVDGSTARWKLLFIGGDWWCGIRMVDK